MTGSRDGASGSAPLVVARWLSLAAAPTFAAMALVAGATGEVATSMHGAAHHASPMSGMVIMYLLMGLFHTPPWLQLLSRRPAGTLATPTLPAAVGAGAEHAEPGLR